MTNEIYSNMVYLDPYIIRVDEIEPMLLVYPVKDCSCCLRSFDSLLDEFRNCRPPPN